MIASNVRCKINYVCKSRVDCQYMGPSIVIGSVCFLSSSVVLDLEKQTYSPFQTCLPQGQTNWACSAAVLHFTIQIPGFTCPLLHPKCILKFKWTPVLKGFDVRVVFWLLLVQCVLYISIVCFAFTAWSIWMCRLL